MSDRGTPFFVGYLKVPPALRGFLIGVMVAGVAVFAALGYIIGTTQDDPGNGAFRFDYGRQEITGTIELMPYPLLHVTEGNERIPAGHTLMLAGQGKSNVIERAAAFLGGPVAVSGILLERGDLDMLQVDGGARGLAAAEGAPGALAAPENLGRWRLAGEICDGKCLAGAMRPGRGLAHKACANLCIIGDIPPVFVSSQPVEGEDFLLVAGPDGGPMPEAAYDYIAQYVEVEGEVERRGDLLVLRIDPGTLQVLP